MVAKYPATPAPFGPKVAKPVITQIGKLANWEAEINLVVTIGAAVATTDRKI